MNTFKKLTEEIKAKLTEQFNTVEVKDAIAKIKATGDHGTFKIVVSTDDTDRSGEIIDQNGWDLSYYKMNPIVLWAHDYSKLPVGVTENIYVDGNKLVAEGRFASAEANPDAQFVRRLYDEGIIKTASVGFLPLEWGENNTISKAQLLEWSFVPVPCNPMALTLAKEMHLDAGELVQKGILLKAEEAEAVVEEEVAPEIVEEEAVVDAPVAAEGEEVVEAPVEETPATTEPEAPAEVVESVEEAKPQEEVEKKPDEEPVAPVEAAPSEEPVVEETPVEEKTVQKAGRVLSGANEARIKTAVSGMKAAVVALEELLNEVASAQGDEEEEEPAKATPAPKVNAAGLDASAVKELNDFFAIRGVLRLVNNVTSDALAKMKKQSLKDN